MTLYNFCRKAGAVLQIMVKRKENVTKMARVAPARYQNCRWQSILGSLSKTPKNGRQLPGKKVESRTVLRNIFWELNSGD